MARLTGLTSIATVAAAGMIVVGILALLNAWGWSVIGTIATLAGIILIILGAILSLLPLANWQINLRRRRPPTGAV